MGLLFAMTAPLIIAGVALYGVGRGVDVYDALIHGGGEGLEVLLRIVPSLIALMTAVYMLRASGALELAAQVLAPLLDRAGVPAQLLPLMLVRPISGRPGGGGGAHPVLGPGLLPGPGGGGDAGLHRDHLLHHRRLLRVGGRLPHPVRHPGRPVRRPHRLSGRRLGGAAVLRHGLRNSPSNHGRNWGRSCTFPCK